MNTRRKIRRIAVVAGDNQRSGLIEWSYFNRRILNRYEVIANEATTELLRGTLNIPITLLTSDSGDDYRELSKLIQNNEVDILIFFGSLSKDDVLPSGIRELLVLANRQNIVTASNRATANFIVNALEADIELTDDTEPFAPKSGTYEFEEGRTHSMFYRANFISRTQGIGPAS